MNVNESILQRLQLNRNGLRGSVAVVTGAGRGIGRAVAILLAALGARVAIAELDEESGRAAENDIRAGGGEAMFVRTDVSDADAVTQLAAAVHRAYGSADILINNAILCPVCSVLDIDPDLWDRVMAVNVRGALLTCKAFLPTMLSAGRGTVVNMVSTDAMAFMSAYISSKQALAAFSQSLSAEVAGRGVRVIALAPGFVETPGLREAGSQLAPRMGMSQEEFLSLSLHPAYQGMMPVDDAAYATAHLIMHLADECAGEVVTGYTVLERAGYIARAAGDQTGDGDGTVRGATSLPRIEPAVGNAGALPQALELIAQLRQALGETEAEFNRLPVFVRPMARGGFKSKAGQSLAEWQHTLAMIEAQLTGTSPVPALATERPRLWGLLEKLIAYYQGVPAETARFTKDRSFIEETRQMCERRVAVAQALILAIERLA